MISVYVSLAELPHNAQHAHAHGLLSECLQAEGAEYIPGLTQLTVGEHGKPSLAERPDIHFNLSHANGVCACLADRDECGIDCECVREYKPRVAERVFSPSELELISAADEAERGLLFFRLWTLKEAFVKAIGVGISYPMNTVSFTLAGDSIASNLPDRRFAQFVINGKAIVSVCTKQPIVQTVTRIETVESRLVLPLSS